MPAATKGGKAATKGAKLPVQPAAVSTGKVTSAKGAVGKGVAGRGAFGNGAAAPKGAGKGKGAAAAAPAGCKVWVGRIGACTQDDILAHFSNIGVVKDIGMKKGSAVVTFETQDEVEQAIGFLNGSDINGQVIEVDNWTGR